jgi:hypothetical protein
LATNPPPTAPLLPLPGHDAAASVQPTDGSNIQRSALIVAIVIEAILLFLNTGTILLSSIQNSGYANPQQQSGSVNATLVTLSVIGLASFLLPVVIGALARSWRTAVALPILAVWAAAIVTVVSLFFTRPSNGVTYPPSCTSRPEAEFPVSPTIG